MSRTMLPEESNAGSLRVVCIVFLVLNTIFYALWIASRYLQKAKQIWADLCMAFAFVVGQAVCIDGLLSIQWGVGRHFDELLKNVPQEIPNWGRNSFYALPGLYAGAVALPKISVLLIYLRIFVDSKQRAMCWAVLVILVVNAIVNIFTTVFQCSYLEAIWSSPDKCTNFADHATYGSLPNIITDIIMLLLPIPLLLKLQAAIPVKVGLAATFLVGSLGLVTSIIRFAKLIQYKTSPDPTWVTVYVVNWTIVEISMYFISASLLTCRPLLSRMMGSRPATATISWFRQQGSYITSRSGHSGERRRSPTFGKKTSDRTSVTGNEELLVDPSSHRPGDISVKYDISVETISV